MRLHHTQVSSRGHHAGRLHRGRGDLRPRWPSGTFRQKSIYRDQYRAIALDPEYPRHSDRCAAHSRAPLPCGHGPAAPVGADTDDRRGYTRTSQDSISRCLQCLGRLAAGRCTAQARVARHHGIPRAGQPRRTTHTHSLCQHGTLRPLRPGRGLPHPAPGRRTSIHTAGDHDC